MTAMLLAEIAKTPEISTFWIFVFAFLVMGLLGLLLGLFLVIAEKYLAVEVDPRFEKVMDLLPQVNCGACGYSGCSGYADALVAGTDPDFTKCAPGGPDIIEDLEGIVRNVKIEKDEGKEEFSDNLKYKSEAVKKKTKSFKKSLLNRSKVKYATLLCNGGFRAKDRMQYSGINNCESAHVLYGGQKGCTFGCMGFGDCAISCPFGAITISKEDGLPKIDKAICTGCGICVDVCPKNILELMSADTPVVVACSNTEIGGHVKKNCDVACIACKRCAKACPEGAIEIIDNLSKIDYDKCKGCGECVKVCPTKAIMIGHDASKIAGEIISKAFSI